MTQEHCEVIDGILYKTKTLPATEGLILLPKLIQLMGEEGIQLFLATTEEQKDSLMGDAEVVGALVSHIASNAAENDGLLVVKRLLQRTTCDKIKIGDNFIEGKVTDHFDDHFAGKYLHLLNVCIWVGRASFGGL